MYVYTYMYIYLVHVRTRFKKIDEQKGRKRETERARGNVIEREGMVHVAGREEEKERERERKLPLEIGSWTGQFCNTRVATRQSIRLEFAPFTVRCNLSIHSLSLSPPCSVLANP